MAGVSSLRSDVSSVTHVKLNAIGILCAEVVASMAFYELLGLDFGNQQPDDGHVEADLGGGLRLMLDSHEVAKMFKPEFEPPDRNDVMTLAVELSSPAEVDQSFEMMAGRGYDTALEPFDAFWGQRYAAVRDPDGNQVDLYAALSTAD